MPDFDIVEIPEQHTAVIRGEFPPEELPALFHRAFTDVFPAVERQGISPTGAPLGYYPVMPGDLIEVEAGVTVSAPITADGDVTPGRLPGGRAVHGVHVGPFDALRQTYEQLATWAAEQGLTLGPGMWEVYLTDPEEEPDPANWRTEIFWPLVG